MTTDKKLAIASVVLSCISAAAFIVLLVSAPKSIQQVSHHRKTTAALVCPDNPEGPLPAWFAEESAPEFKKPTLDWSHLAAIETLYGEDNVVCYIKYVYNEGVEAKKQGEFTPDVQLLFNNIQQYLTEKGVI